MSLEVRPPGFWLTTWLLLRAARKRTSNRMRKDRVLRQRRAWALASNWGGFGLVPLVLVFAVIHGMAAFAIRDMVLAGERVAAEQQGRLPVSDFFASRVRGAEQQEAGLLSASKRIDLFLRPYYQDEGRTHARQFGGDPDSYAWALQSAVLSGHSADLVLGGEVRTGLRGVGSTGLPAMLGSVLLLLWAMTLITPLSDGDPNRQRHPIWEFLLSHPVRPGAVFLAEMLSPILGTPLLATAPVLPGLLYGQLYGVASGLAAGVLVGVPVMLAAACLSKSIEIALTLRTTPRTRGGALGLMTWASTTAIGVLPLTLTIAEPAASLLGPKLTMVAALPWPWLGLLLGRTGDGTFSFVTGVLTCAGLACLVSLLAIGVAAWGAGRGLTGPAGRRVQVRPRRRQGFGRDPLLRKELLWFARDRSALMQAVLMPLTMAGVQLFNFRGVLASAGSRWHVICGSAILFGTYFLSILGPKSLAAEGTAL